MILFKHEYHHFIEVYHWSWMQAVSTFTFLTTSKWNPNDTDWKAPNQKCNFQGNPKTRKPETRIRNRNPESETGIRNPESGIRKPQITEN